MYVCLRDRVMDDRQVQTLLEIKLTTEEPFSLHQIVFKGLLRKNVIL